MGVGGWGYALAVGAGAVAVCVASVSVSVSVPVCVCVPLRLCVCVCHCVRGQPLRGYQGMFRAVMDVMAIVEQSDTTKIPIRGRMTCIALRGQL